MDVKKEVNIVIKPEVLCDEIIISSMKVTQLIVSLPLSTVLPPDLVFCQMSQPYSRVHGGKITEQYSLKIYMAIYLRSST